MEDLEDEMEHPFPWRAFRALIDARLWGIEDAAGEIVLPPTITKENAEHLVDSAIANDLLDLLTEVRNACLFDDDDGQIGVTTEPSIDPVLFDRICVAINRRRPPPSRANNQ